MEAGAKAAPDGYTIASATIGTLAINQFLSKGLPYDPERGFAYVSTFWMNCNVFLVPSQHNPAKTLHEFLAWTKTDQLDRDLFVLPIHVFVRGAPA